MKKEYCIKKFDDLKPNELYEILKLRNTVFIVEQNCPYQDIDGKDKDAYHLIYYIDNIIVGYTRLLPAGISYPEVSIGRVVINPNYRGLKLGKDLMEKSISACQDLFEDFVIRISAQQYLIKFYHSLGFNIVGETYLEDGIPHIEMIKDKV